MLKSIVIKLAKRYVVKALNETLAAKSDDVAKAKSFLETWLARVKVVLAALEKALAYLEDNKLDDGEVEDIVKTVENALEGRLCAGCSE